MDQYTSDLLIKWGLLEYVSVFAAARIDSMTLEMLEPNDVAQLINPIGDQLRFKANLEVWKKEMVVAGQNRNVTADVNETPLDSSFMGRLLRDLDNPSENCSPSTSIQRDSSCLAPESDNIENEVILILQKTLEGRAILAKGQHNNGLLNLELRKELANLIIRDKLQADPNKLLSEHSTVEVAELLKIWNILTLDPGRQLNRLGLQHFLHGYIFVPRKGTLADYLNRFPILKSPSGYHLLLQDFQKLYPENVMG
ncbi:hypothetical protein EVAR_24311_1 [Eumeta japonica]|uniref:SAM domain-containing protein n=1 Tax=Eumeta variegata TaxID=151549 RepID=A0A4C1VL95_EUMVA|nr:hypothetical protein EVAR_24311_1 [Eumeta japonica]